MGYKTEDEARKAKDWFDGTFGFGGGKVKVDFVRDEVSNISMAPICGVQS